MIAYAGPADLIGIAGMVCLAGVVFAIAKVRKHRRTR